eukprot:gene17895-23512_t
MDEHEQSIHEHAVLFVSSNDKPLSANDCSHKGIQCEFNLNNDWVQARNKLVKKVYEYENSIGYEFKYWLFADSNTLNVTCLAHNTGPIAHKSSSCIARFVHFLLARTSYAQVYLIPSTRNNELEVREVFCGNSFFHAIHRAAVPILLPYVQSKDKQYNYESQSILSLISNGCLGRNSIGSAMLSYDHLLTRKKIKQSVFDVPNDKFRQTAITKVFVERGIPAEMINYSRDGFSQLCAQVPTGYIVGLIHTNSSAAWRNRHAYHKCMKALKPRFIDYVTNGTPEEF